jgi:hypothetical protein
MPGLSVNCIVTTSPGASTAKPNTSKPQATLATVAGAKTFIDSEAVLILFINFFYRSFSAAPSSGFFDRFIPLCLQKPSMSRSKIADKNSYDTNQKQLLSHSLKILYGAKN